MIFDENFLTEFTIFDLAPNNKIFLPYVTGLDCEWDWDSQSDNNLPVIQIATANMVYVIHQLPRIPPKFREILESPKIQKVGVAVQGDLDRIARKYNIAPSGGVDLRHLAAEVCGEKEWSLDAMTPFFKLFFKCTKFSRIIGVT